MGANFDPETLGRRAECNGTSISGLSDSGGALVPGALGQDAGAPLHPSTAIAKAESLQERKSHGGPQQEAPGEAPGEAQGNGEVRGPRSAVHGQQLRIIGQSEGDGEVRAPRSAARGHQFIGESGVHGTLPMGVGQE